MMPPPPPHRSPLKRLSLSPPAWKDQLRQRCLQRLKRDRGQLLDKLRRPDALSVSEEMQRLVAHEQQQQQQQQASLSASASVDDLLLMGRLKESDYLDIVHALEDALRHETEEEDDEEELRLAEHMADLEDAELEAMLAGMDLGGQQEQNQQQQLPATSDAGYDDAELGDFFSQDPSSISVLCPICKAGYLSEHAGDRAAVPCVSCGCGFSFHVKYVYHGVLEDFQDKIVNAFMAHRDLCPSDPTFEKKTSLDEGTDVLLIKCEHCGCSHALP
ncbi:hypothetical protein PF005_g24591 [Phytophthora fragariae]|uniref:RPA-interacting protein C-terminal domain-containing protein n=2 Tax=Phytophthora TaxID=4783 RepID=A0A6A3QKN2_9STRA|nr:hypothetical protein PF003_g31574 [Phytophthora fragariae]KAE9037490.1 hypothetical protein PR002_g6550 [Phytophthora rubi]KAE8924735.1 hypothetical protein PF009_g25040 [Phytophthora fragariae]KAE8978848.1 hypothetical protein PF011_g23080 [Phytophthora fragariae]KAE9042199.1 hypothetical protein PR001_g6291 [Phytophthora rubi]